MGEADVGVEGGNRVDSVYVLKVELGGFAAKMRFEREFFLFYSFIYLIYFF